MKKLFNGILLSIGVMAFISSCGSLRTAPPKAANTICQISFGELNLSRDKYEIMDLISAEATISCEYMVKGAKSANNEMIITSPEDSEFYLRYIAAGGPYILAEYTGVMRLGYLFNDDLQKIQEVYYPEYVARHTAIYRLISLAKEMGADGIIEPLIATNVEESLSSRRHLTAMYKTTITGKPVRIKTDK